MGQGVALQPDASATEAALAVLDADELRGLIHDMMPLLDESARASTVNTLIERAARKRSGWTPAGPSKETVAGIVRFAKTAAQGRYVDPSLMDDYLQEGSNAFFAGDYQAAREIFHALLLALGNGDIYIGEEDTYPWQDEMEEEILGTDTHACAVQYVVSVYMTTAPEERAPAVLAAVRDMSAVAYLEEPLREMETVAMEPLPELEEFLNGWRALMAERIASERTPGHGSDWGLDVERWQREVVARMEGTAGLARVARDSKRPDDLRAWCNALAIAKDWKKALAACEEAAGLITDNPYMRGELLDGAALAAQELGKKDVPARLLRAWQAAPTMTRLQRWLGCFTTAKTLRRRAAEALDTCPKRAGRQRALLHALSGDLAAAAELLANAPGLGWSNEDHPGHLLFALFYRLLGGGSPPAARTRRSYATMELARNDDRPHLATPEIETLVAQAEITAPEDDKTRTAVLRAMRKAAEKRVQGVTEKQRRNHYEHAAALALACDRVENSPDSTAWLAELRNAYRRYPALQQAFKNQELYR